MGETVQARWHDGGTYVDIVLPSEFNYRTCLDYLSRSSNECLHAIEEALIYKGLSIDGQKVLVRIQEVVGCLRLEFLGDAITAAQRAEVAAYVWQWFDLGTNLATFYLMAKDDKLLREPAKAFHGLRLLGVPDLWEALAWAITGQQINLPFAYILRKRFVECFGESLKYDDREYWLHPSPATVLALSVADLAKLQFTSRKAEYIIGIAEAIEHGRLSLDGLRALGSFRAMRERLLAIRGVGPWTADYVLMRCLRDPDAFPVADVGLQNAVKFGLSLDRKPTEAELKTLAEQWRGFRAYATFYLWRTLY